ncbi:MAG: hypothetical protein KKC39_04655 [Candidatus Omnitrophica bacterium]|nr:hypothetical protein [Candidatus Omnitrophota bacterium]MBU4303821.1 hypothetical protein [Candidatus Omnitrophota bacterium]MBU4468012.1 hypothetical protein [Candidatus Omnitrophota bacterium]MCG2707809.1 hypothetical protein [Candidatus Omnitrophota bacterium]
MTQKDKYLFVQLGLTFSLLITAVFLLKPAVFWQYQLFLIGGSAVGFAFSWHNRQGAFEDIKYFIDAAILIIITWIGYRIFKSTFLYKEIIAILIQGVIIMEIIFSFNFCAKGKIVYIQLLSLIIFMTSAVFATAYSMFLAIVYLLIWLAILRFQFAGFLQPLREKGVPRYYSLVTSLVCFLVALLLAWFISANVFLGKIKNGTILLDEDLQDMESVGGKESNEADKFYSLQEDLQKKMSDLSLKLDSYEKRRQLIYLLSELVKDTLKTIELDKAEIGLIDILKRQGAGLEGAAQAITMTKMYLDKKNSRNLENNKEEIMDRLRKHPLGIFDKIKITSLANKIQQANSYQQLQENSRALQSAIQNAPLSRDVQKDLSALARDLSNLKVFEFYRRKIQDLEQRLPLLGEEIEKKIADVVSDIKHTQGLDDFKQTAKKIRQLKNDSRIGEQKLGKDVIKSLEEVSRMKLDLLFTEKSEKVRKYASQKQYLGSLAEEFDQKMDGVGSAMNHQEFIKEFSGLSQQNKDNNLGLAEGLGEMLDLKIESFKQVKKDKLDNLVSKDFSSEVKKEMLGATEQMEEKESARDLESQQEDLASKIRELERKGSVSPESAAEILKAAADLKDLLQARLMAKAELKKEEVSEKDLHKSDYLEQLQQAIKDSSLSSREKETLKALLEQLLKAQSLSQLEDVKEVLKKELSFLRLQEASAVKLREINKIDEKFKQAAKIKQQFLASKALADILEKIERLSQQDAAKAQALEEKLEQLRESNSPEEVEKIILDLKDILNSESAQVGSNSMVEPESKQQWKIYILSSSLIVSQGITVPLKVIAVDKNGYIKELTSDVEWFSTQQQVARVDDLNFLYPLAKGKAKIRAVYKGVASKDVEVNVVADIDAQAVQTIKQELLQ